MTDEEKKARQRKYNRKSYEKTQALKYSDNPEDVEKYNLLQEKRRDKANRYYDNNRLKVSTKAAEKYKTKTQLEYEILAEKIKNNAKKIEEKRIEDGLLPGTYMTHKSRGRA